MVLLPAVQDVLFFIQAWKIASKLAAFLDCMEVPRFRKRIDKLHNLQWLARNLHIENQDHHLYPEAKELLKLMFWDSRYNALDWVMWRSIE